MCSNQSVSDKATCQSNCRVNIKKALCIIQIVAYHAPNTSWVDVRLYQLGVAVLLVPVALVRTLRALTYMSVGANIVMFTAHIVIFQYCIRFIQPLSAIPAYKLSSSDLLTLGMSVFAFSGIANVSSTLYSDEKTTIGQGRDGAKLVVQGLLVLLCCF